MEVQQLQETPEEKKKKQADLMAAFLQRKKDEADKLANDKKAEQLVQQEKEAGKQRLEAALKESGTISVNGKSLGRVLAAKEEKEGQENIGRNPEEVVIGEKRTDWNHK